MFHRESEHLRSGNESHLKSARVKLRPLSVEVLSNATAVAQRIFIEPKDSAAIAREYEMSVHPGEYSDEIEKSGFKSLKYWFVNQAKKPKKIVGITGLETRIEDPDDIAWLGWFGVVPEVRGKGFGRAILKKTISKARSIGFDRLRLWTTTSSSEVAAQDMYEDFNFHLIGQEDIPNSEQQVLFREKIL